MKRYLKADYLNETERCEHNFSIYIEVPPVLFFHDKYQIIYYNRVTATFILEVGKV